LSQPPHTLLDHEYGEVRICEGFHPIYVAEYLSKCLPGRPVVLRLSLEFLDPVLGRLKTLEIRSAMCHRDIRGNPLRSCVDIWRLLSELNRSGNKVLYPQQRSARIMFLTVGLPVEG
jgi:hypothetical protein